MRGRGRIAAHRPLEFDDVLRDVVLRLGPADQRVDMPRHVAVDDELEHDGSALDVDGDREQARGVRAHERALVELAEVVARRAALFPDEAVELSGQRARALAHIRAAQLELALGPARERARGGEVCGEKIAGTLAQLGARKG